MYFSNQPHPSNGVKDHYICSNFGRDTPFEIEMWTLKKSLNDPIL